MESLILRSNCGAVDLLTTKTRSNTAFKKVLWSLDFFFLVIEKRTKALYILLQQHRVNDSRQNASQSSSHPLPFNLSKRDPDFEKLGTLIKLVSFPLFFSEKVLYAISRHTNVTLPVVLVDNDSFDLDILPYSGADDIRVGIDLNEKLLSLCRPTKESESRITDLSLAGLCNPKLNMTNSLNHKGVKRLSLTLNLFDQKVL